MASLAAYRTSQAARALALLLALSAPAFGDGTTITGKARVVDGDTLDVDGVRVRLNGLAAPERGEPGGREATRFMVDATRREAVTCELTGEQSYDREIGRCFVDGEDLAALAVAAGVARDCPRFSDGRYAALETDEGRQLALPRYCEVR